jgi:spore coat protein A
VPPGTRTRIVAQFDRPGQYVWHCHILSHEDHEMMRPFLVRGP